MTGGSTGRDPLRSRPEDYRDHTLRDLGKVPLSDRYPYHVILIPLELPLFGLFAGGGAASPLALDVLHLPDTDGSLIVFEIIILIFTFQCYLQMAPNQFHQE